MAKAVFDTNVFVSAAIAAGPCNKLIQAVEKRKFTLFVSEEILQEVEETLRDPEFRFNPRQIRIYLRKIRNMAKTIKNPQILRIVKDDPDDDKILGCAVAAKANYLVTGDYHLLNIKKFKQFKIVRVKEFMEVLERTQKL